MRRLEREREKWKELEGESMREAKNGGKELMRRKDRVKEMEMERD